MINPSFTVFLLVRSNDGKGPITMRSGYKNAILFSNCLYKVVEKTEVRLSRQKRTCVGKGELLYVRLGNGDAKFTCDSNYLSRWQQIHTISHPHGLVTHLSDLSVCSRAHSEVMPCNSGNPAVHNSQTYPVGECYVDLSPSLFWRLVHFPKATLSRTRCAR